MVPHVQACKLIGGHEVVTLELLPQLVPLFLCPPDQRGAYGSSIPPAAPSAIHPARSVCFHSTMSNICNVFQKFLIIRFGNFVLFLSSLY